MPGCFRAREGLDLALEALARAGKVEQLRAHELQRHLASERGLLGAEDDPHPAPAQALEQAEVPQALGELALRHEPHGGERVQAAADLRRARRVSGAQRIQRGRARRALALERRRELFLEGIEVVGLVDAFLAPIPRRSHVCLQRNGGGRGLGLVLLPQRSRPGPRRRLQSSAPVDDVAEQCLRASSGDATAVESLLARYAPEIEAYVARRGGPLVRAHESSADVAQSVCREALERLRSGRFRFQGEAQFRQWLYRAALLKLMARARYWKAERRDGAAPLHSESQLAPAAASTPSENAARVEELAALERALAELGERQREVVALAYGEGLSHAEIAERLGTSEAYSRTLLSRALVRLSRLGQAPGSGGRADD